jgi:hypothetical protein
MLGIHFQSVTPMIQPLIPFRRLRIYDGLSIDADRWQQSHRYHRLRQNFHYQALHQAGILCGLGVAPIDDPTAIEGQPKSGRWLQIQPGMAIDAAGNPIIVPEAMTFPIQAEIRPGEQQTIYLVANYVDPDDLRHGSEREWVQETFRIRETTCLDLLDVELCRVTLLPGEVWLSVPDDVMGDAIAGQLDLRDRQRVQVKPQVRLKAAYLDDRSSVGNHGTSGNAFAHSSSNYFNPELNSRSRESTIADRWNSFAKSVSSLDSRFSADPNLQLLDLAELGQADYDIFWLTEMQLKSLPTDTYAALRYQLDKGGLLVIQVDPAALNLHNLMNVAQELQQAIRESERDQTLSQQKLQLKLELKAIADEIADNLEKLIHDLAPIASQLGQSLVGSGELEGQHPLRRSPFLFSQLPTIAGQPLQVLNWGGLVLMIGDLSRNWQIDADFSQSREEIRAAQEFGINLLDFAWQRCDRTQLYRNPIYPNPISPPTR